MLAGHAIICLLHTLLMSTHKAHREKSEKTLIFVRNRFVFGYMEYKKFNFVKSAL